METISQKPCHNMSQMPFMSKTDTPRGFTCRTVFDALRASWGQNGEVAFYEDIARRLSQIAGKEKPWGWRYVQSVDHNTLGHEPSKSFVQAVEILAASLDSGVPEFVMATEPTTVYARPGAIHPNSIVLAESKPCVEPTCTIHFVPRVPWQKYCPQHKDRRNRTQ